jgi:hypothetical protein
VSPVDFEDRIPEFQARFSNRDIDTTATEEFPIVENIGADRNHLSLIKDLAPEMGRNFKLLYNVGF